MFIIHCAESELRELIGEHPIHRWMAESATQQAVAGEGERMVRWTGERAQEVAH